MTIPAAHGSALVPVCAQSYVPPAATAIWYPAHELPFGDKSAHGAPGPAPDPENVAAPARISSGAAVIAPVVPESIAVDALLLPDDDWSRPGDPPSPDTS